MRDGQKPFTALGSALIAALVCAPCAVAGPYCTEVRTVSGKVECIISSKETACFSKTGFQGSPSENSDYLAIVQSDGTFAWQYAGGLGNCGGADIAALPYGSDQTFNGWDVQAAENGTTFTNQSSGHGMFVSIESTRPI